MQLNPEFAFMKMQYLVMIILWDMKLCYDLMCEIFSSKITYFNMTLKIDEYESLLIYMTYVLPLYFIGYVRTSES